MLPEPQTAAEIYGRYRAARANLWPVRIRASHYSYSLGNERLADLRAGLGQPVFMCAVAEAAAKCARISVRDLTGATRSGDVMPWRFAAIYIIRRDSPVSKLSIGKFFGGRDHSTIINSLRRVAERPSRYARYIKAIERELMPEVE